MNDLMRMVMYICDRNAELLPEARPQLIRARRGRVVAQAQPQIRDWGDVEVREGPELRPSPTPQSEVEGPLTGRRNRYHRVRKYLRRYRRGTPEEHTGWVKACGRGSDPDPEKLPAVERKVLPPE